MHFSTALYHFWLTCAFWAIIYCLILVVNGELYVGNINTQTSITCADTRIELRIYPIKLIGRWQAPFCACLHVLYSTRIDGNNADVIGEMPNSKHQIHDGSDCDIKMAHPRSCADEVWSARRAAATGWSKTPIIVKLQKTSRLSKATFEFQTRKRFEKTKTQMYNCIAQVGGPSLALPTVLRDEKVKDVLFDNFAQALKLKRKARSTPFWSNQRSRNPTILNLIRYDGLN